jgi:hypothetical protein
MGAPVSAAQTGAATVAVARRSVVPLPFALHQTATATTHGQHLETLGAKTADKTISHFN